VARGPGEKLGISVQGGVGSRCGNPFDSTDEGIFISQVSTIIFHISFALILSVGMQNSPKFSK